MELGVSSVNFSLIKIIVASLFYTLFIVVFHFIGQLPAYVEIAFTLLFTLFFLTETVQIVMKIGAKLTSSTQSDWDGVERIKYGLFLLFAEIFLSLLLIICVFIKLDYIYIWSIICILTAFNGYIFIAPFYLENSDVREDDETGIAIKRDIYVKDKGGRTLNDRLRADDLYERLIIYFDQKKPYLRQNLKIKEVALYLYSNKTYLSRIINDKHNLNFNQFVNYYRIEEVKRIFAENSSLNIQELCTRSGFGSMATFSIAFRYYLGNTPADWCKEQKLLREHEQ